MLDCNFWPCMCWRRTSWMQSNISCSLIWARKNRFGQQLNWDGPHCPGKVRLISFPLSPSYSCYIKCIHAEPSRAEPPVTSFLVTWSFLHLFSFFFFNLRLCFSHSFCLLKKKYFKYNYYSISCHIQSF